MTAHQRTSAAAALLISFALLTPASPERAQPPASTPSPGERRPSLFFCGAEGTIFGSNYLLDTGARRIVLDCGLFFEPEWIKYNDSFPFDPGEVDACAITHAHIDHVGKVPLLFAKGFRGLVYCTAPTKAMAATLFDLVMRGTSDEETSPYSETAVRLALENMKTLQPDSWRDLGGGTRLRLIPTGHILGAVMVEVAFVWKGKEYTFLFTGDTRNPHSPLTPQWEKVKRADWLLLESVYGNRLHGDFKKEFDEFTRRINEAIMHRGTVMIPTYSVDKTQKILYYLYLLKTEGKLARTVDVYVDSPMANKITDDYVAYYRYLAPSVRRLFEKGINPLDFPGLHRGGPPRSKRGAKIIIAPSAMCDVGNIRKHLAQYLKDKNSAIIFTGFVAPDSLGGEILAGKEWVKINGTSYPVRCSAYNVSAFSGHADQAAILEWLKGFDHVGVVLVIHGLPEGSAGLAQKIRDEFGWKTCVPRYLERLDLIDILDSAPPCRTPSPAAP
jgi:metallo-beta-lactamase family protein